MKIRTWIYSLKQGVINIKRNKLYSLASIATISICIFLIGLFYSVYINLLKIYKNINYIIFNIQGGEEMAVVEELIRKEDDGTLSFGNFELDSKKKLSDFEFEGDLYKVKTFREITKLEKNGLFVYESVPGTVVTHMKADDTEIKFSVEGYEDASVTLELEPEKEYKVYIQGTNVGKMKTNLGGKLLLSLELDPGQVSEVKVVKL